MTTHLLNPNSVSSYHTVDENILLLSLSKNINELYCQFCKTFYKTLGDLLSWSV